MGQDAFSASGKSQGPDTTIAASLQSQGYHAVAGVDEAGRGPLAGPVVAAAVILPPECDLAAVRDSKRLSATKREALCGTIQAQARAWAVGEATPAEIDELNILQASLLAMRRAVTALQPAPDYVLVDGRQTLGGSWPQQAVVKGDQRELAIAAASIVAKVTRDRVLVEMEATYPGYGFARHKGYPSAAHKAALAALGPCEQHRRSFRGVVDKGV